MIAAKLGQVYYRYFLFKLHVNVALVKGAGWPVLEMEVVSSVAQHGVSIANAGNSSCGRWSWPIF